MCELDKGIIFSPADWAIHGPNVSISISISLREVELRDWELIMAWRNIPQVYQGMYSQKAPLTWEEHARWSKSRYNWQRWIIQFNDGLRIRSVGVVNLSQLDCWYPQIGYLIGETILWGKGVATQAVNLALDWLRQRKQYARCWTTVKKDNLASIRVLEKCGFERIGEGRDGEWFYEVKL